VGHGLSTAETVLPQVANMAAATLQLGRGLSTAETYSRSAVKVKQLRFNWAAVFQPRKHDCVLQPESPPPRFNWAAVFQPRKQSQLHASLLPSQGFNWAAVFQPRKLEAKIAKHRIIPASIGPRSFNRGNWLAGLPRRSRRLASIGPRSFNRGN